MTLSEIEMLAIKRCLSAFGIYVDHEETFFSDLKVLSREFSGSGFFTDLEISKKLNVETTETSSKWGDFHAKLNSSIDTGYLLYIEEGHICSIEGYTYGEEWPHVINEIKEIVP